MFVVEKDYVISLKSVCVGGGYMKICKGWCGLFYRYYNFNLIKEMY